MNLARSLNDVALSLLSFCILMTLSFKAEANCYSKFEEFSANRRFVNQLIETGANPPLRISLAPGERDQIRVTMQKNNTVWYEHDVRICITGDRISLTPPPNPRVHNRRFLPFEPTIINLNVNGNEVTYQPISLGPTFTFRASVRRDGSVGTTARNTATAAPSTGAR